jgi:hypothetical protein
VIRLKKCSSAAAGIAVLLLGCLGACMAQKGAKAGAGTEEAVYKCDTPGIQLEGVLTQRMFYGPPGFGETPAKDVHDKVLVLKLAKPITVKPTDDAEAKNSPNLSTFKHVRQIQLFFGGSRSAEVDARKLIGKSVVVVGALDEATAPRQYTDVTMEVKTLQAK